MPNIAFISPKGGAGKTTAALLLALGLAERGEHVAIVDSDPNKPLVHWAEEVDAPREISVHAAPTVQDIRDATREAQRHNPRWIIVDTEGSERGAMVFAAVRFDLVLTPVAGSHLDLREAVKAAEIVRAFGRRAGKPLLHYAVLTRVPPMVKPRTLSRVVEALRRAQIAILPTPLLEKEAFRAIFSVGGFDQLQDEGAWGVSAARVNTAGYVDDVVRLLGQGHSAGTTAAASATVSYGG